MVNFYAADLTRLPDEELRRLAAEIEAANVLNYDDEDWPEWPEGSWKEQAPDRYRAIQMELRRRAGPIDLIALDKYLEQQLPKLSAIAAQHIDQLLIDEFFHPQPDRQ